MNVLCDGCDRPVWEAHKTIEEHIACCAAQQERVRAELDAQDAAEPKFDRRFTGPGRSRRLVKSARKA